MQSGSMVPTTSRICLPISSISLSGAAGVTLSMHECDLRCVCLCGVWCVHEELFPVSQLFPALRHTEWHSNGAVHYTGSRLFMCRSRKRKLVGWTLQPVAKIVGYLQAPRVCLHCQKYKLWPNGTISACFQLQKEYCYSKNTQVFGVGVDITCQ